MLAWASFAMAGRSSSCPACREGYAGTGCQSGQGRGAITLEKIALLRVRLKKDNSELIEFAIEELFRKHNAKRAFGDA
jgi:hypothetical protein